MLPLLVEVRDKFVLVVGSGRVGQRKARRFSAAGAHVTLWDKEVAPPMDIEAAVVRQALAQFNLIVLATNDEGYNQWLEFHARQLGIWCNRADSTAFNDFHTMASVRRGLLSVSVGTEGALPGLSKQLTQALEALFPEELGEDLDALAKLRAAILSGPPEEKDESMAALQQKIDALVADVTDKWPKSK